MAVHENDLYVGGYFGFAGSVEAYHVAKWNGTEWAPIGIGVGGAPGAHVNALAVADGYLYVGGYFNIVGDAENYAIPVNSIARFNLATERWENLGAGVEIIQGLTGTVHDFDIVEDSIFVVGEFNTIDWYYSPNVGILVDGKWVNQFSSVNLGVEGLLRTVKVINGQRYIGGIILLDSSAPIENIARWEGNHWVAFEDGLYADNQLGYVNDIQPYGTGFVAGGFFQRAGDLDVNSIAYFDGSSWNSLGEGIHPLLYEIAVKDNHIYVGGPVMTSGSIISAGLAMYEVDTPSPVTPNPVINDQYLLEQNFPNPCHVTTSITYFMPQSRRVRIDLFDAKGARLQTLLDEYRPSGKHTLEINTYQLPAGFYHYRMDCGGVVQSRKMIVY